MIRMIINEIKQEIKHNRRSYELNKISKQEYKINKVCLKQDLEDALDELKFGGL